MDKSLTDLRGQTVLVVGLGRSGRAAARLALSCGAQIIGTDTRLPEQLGSTLDDIVGRWFLGGHQEVPWTEASLIVVSPGVPALDALTAAGRRGVLVVSELEFASWFVRVPIVAIGGTNGKSTTTTLAAELLKGVGLRVFAGGNLGTPLSELVLGELSELVLGEQGVPQDIAGSVKSKVAAESGRYSVDVAVVEVSSFQLERSPTFRPRVSALLNISEDHLDRYPSFQDYADAKGNAFAAQTEHDIAIVPVNDPACLTQAHRGRADVVTFGGGGNYAVLPGALQVRTDKVVLEQAAPGLALHGQHNLLNLAAAVACADALLNMMPTGGASWVAPSDRLRMFAKTASHFQPLPHRMARVRERNGVSFYNDSKATNVGAAVTAILGLAEPRCVVIAGGRDKHGSYDLLVEALRTRARAVVLLGEAAGRLADAIGGSTPMTHAPSMAAAVRIAADLAQSGDAVLLSPACSSFDMFTGYADRGEQFSAAVKALP